MGTDNAGSSTTLLLLPGLDGTDVFFRPLLAQLPPTIRPLVLSYPDGGPYSYEELLDLVRGSLSEVPACHVLAASFGGPLAVMLAAAEPDKVRGLILTATFVRTPRPELAPLRWLLRAPLLWTVRVVRRLPLWMRASEDDLRRAKRETWQRVSARGLAGRARAVLAVDVRAALANCGQPLLNVSYDRDTVVRRRYGEEILGHRKHATSACLSGGHLAMFSDPAALAAEVVRFVEGNLP